MIKMYKKLHKPLSIMQFFLHLEFLTPHSHPRFFVNLVERANKVPEGRYNPDGGLNPR